MSPDMRPDGADRWLWQVDTIVWRIMANDPSDHRDVAHPADDAEHDSIAQFAFTLGLLLQVVVDDDEIDDMPYVMWSVEVPSKLHDRAHIRAVPAALADLGAHLIERYRPFENWAVQIDEDQTAQVLLQQTLRNEYDDLIHAIEVALLPLRTTEAARIGALVRSIGADPPTMIGTYSLYVARDDLNDGHWLIVHAGIADATAVAGDNNAARAARRYHLRADTPVLVLPRPSQPLFYAHISRGPHHGGINAILEEPPDRDVDLAADFRWVSHSPKQLANAVLAAAPAWLPQHTSPDPE